MKNIRGFYPNLFQFLEVKCCIYLNRRVFVMAVCNIKWAAPCGNVSSGICGQRRPRSACLYAQSDQGLYCPLTEPFDTTKCMNG